MSDPAVLAALDAAIAAGQLVYATDTLAVDSLVQMMTETPTAVQIPWDAWLRLVTAIRPLTASQEVRELEADPDRQTVTYAGDELEACEAERDRLAAALERLLTLETREEVDMNGEYLTTKDIGASRFKAEVDRIARDVLNPGDG